jgi:hypothetical protein
MGGKGGGSAPQAPDPAATAAAQGQVNKETAIAQARLNRVNEITPLGSRTYEEFGVPEDPDILRARAITTLNPTAQEAFEAEQRVNRDLNLLSEGQIGRVEGTLGQDFDLGGVADRVTNLNTAGFTPFQGQINTAGFNPFQGQINTAGISPFAIDPTMSGEEAIYGRHRARLDPRFQQEESDLRNTLANRGLFAGGEAFNRELGNFGRYRNDAYEQARRDAITQGIQMGNQQRQQQFGEQQAQAGFANQARGQMFNEAGAQAALANAGRTQEIQERAFLRNIPLNDVAALMGTGQVNLPQFGAIPQVGVAAPDYQGAVANQYAGQLSAYNQNQANRAGLTNALIGAGTSAAIAISDRRLKKSIKKIGEWFKGINLYLFSYVWDDMPHVGVMADEVKKVLPDAVYTVNGYDMVDYRKVINAS